MTIAQTILSQLGGNRFVAMTGAKNLLDHGNGLSFKVGRNPKGVTHARITLTAMDDYMVEFLKIRGTKQLQPVAYREGIYADDLAHVFESVTGMATRL
jgi:hypothetical protein